MCEFVVSSRVQFALITSSSPCTTLLPAPKATPLVADFSSIPAVSDDSDSSRLEETKFPTNRMGAPYRQHTSVRTHERLEGGQPAFTASLTKLAC